MRVISKTAGDGQPDNPGNEYDSRQGQEYDPHRLSEADLFQRKDFRKGEREHIEQNANKNGRKKVLRPGQSGQRIIERRLLPPCDNEKADGRRYDKYKRRKDKSQEAFFPQRFRLFKKSDLSHSFYDSRLYLINQYGRRLPAPFGFL